MAKQPYFGAALFTGYIHAPEHGDYCLYLKTSGRAFLRIHETAAVDADFGYHRGSEIQAKMRLTAGFHPVRLYFSRGQEAPFLSLQWSGTNFTKRPIPDNAFSHDEH
jgi:hypothetical protein